MLRIAIVGVGWAGTRQAEAIAELGRKVSIAALVDRDQAFLEAKALELQVAKTYTDYEAALADPDIDAVSICSPHRLHKAMALAAATAGKHILCEKPLALTVEDATLMIDAAAAHGVKLYVAENEVYTSMSKTLRELVQSGQHLGAMTFAVMMKGFRAPDFGYKGRRRWLTRPEAGGTGTWMLHGIHSMAQLRYIFGEVATVYVAEHKTDSFNRRDLEGTISGLLTLADGSHIAIMQSSETRLKGNWGGYLIHGEQGSLRAWNEGYEVGDTPLQPYPAEPLSSYAQELEAFADYVAGHATGPTTAESERRSLAIVQAGYESIQSGQPIHLTTRFGNI